MVIDTTKINTKNWQHKRNSIGEIVEDIYDIKQCIRTIATTQKGSVPFAPEFGCNLMEAIGENSQDSIDYLCAIYLKEIPRQEPRCSIIEINGVFDENGKILMKVYFKNSINNLTEKTEFYV